MDIGELVKNYGLCINGYNKLIYIINDQSVRSVRVAQVAKVLEAVYPETFLMEGNF